MRNFTPNESLVAFTNFESLLSSNSDKADKKIGPIKDIFRIEAIF